VDFALLPLDDLALGLSYGDWKPHTFWDGQTFDVPADFAPRVLPDGALEAPRLRGGPIEMRMPHGGRFFDLIPGERQDSFEIPHQPEAAWIFPAPYTDEFLRREEDKARRLYESCERAIVASPPVAAPQGYAGTYHWAMKMMMEPQHCLDYMMRASEAAATCFAQYLQAVGPYIEVINISGYDYGTQDREMFRPELFRDFYVPAWKPITEVIHRTPQVKVWIHCCGAVPRLIPYFIAAGVDILNPVQWTATGMDLGWLKTTFGDQLTFWGGATSTQRTFPFGTAAEVAREAQGVLDIMAPGGGFVVNPIHNILPDVPVENILALYRTAQAWRYGG
jgi:uroporphyrinogen decarboxylase